MCLNVNSIYLYAPSTHAILADVQDAGHMLKTEVQCDNQKSYDETEITCRKRKSHQSTEAI